jgi:hypothetical protein
MTMVARGADGVYRTQPLETLDNGGGGTLPAVATDVMDAESSAGWNSWWDTRFEPERDSLCKGVAEATMILLRERDQKIEALQNQIRVLELKLAEAVGALDVLCGKEASGSFDVRGTFDPDTVYNYLDVVAFNGSSWVATRDRPGELPGSRLAIVGKRWQARAAGRAGAAGRARQGGPVSASTGMA